MKRLVGQLLGSLLLVSFPAARPPADAGKAPEQWRGQQGGTAEFSTAVLRSAPEWTAFWQSAGRPPPRNLDAKTEMAAVVRAGQRRTGGYVVTVEGVRREQDRWVVLYAIAAPAPGRIATRVLTAPWAIAVLPRFDGPVAFREEPVAVRPGR